MSLRALKTSVLRVLGEWATAPTPTSPGSLWRVVDDGRGYPVLQSRVLTRDRWADADPLRESAAVWDGLCRVFEAARAIHPDAPPKVRETHRPQGDAPKVGETVEDVDGASWTVREVRAQGVVPVVFGVEADAPGRRRFRQVVMTPALRQHLLTHSDWRKGPGLPISKATVKALRDRLGVTLSGLVSARWERATALGGTRTEVAERAGATISAASDRGDDVRRTLPIPRTPEADAAILGAKDDDALLALATAWRSSLKAARDRRNQLRREAGIPSRRGERKGPPRVVLAYGETKTIKEWSRDSRCKTSASTLRARLEDGWRTDVAIETPTGAPPRLARYEEPKSRGIVARTEDRRDPPHPL